MEKMKAKIYKYSDTARIIDLPDKKIRSIGVEILSGDEVVTFNFEDGEIIRVDACDCIRLASFEDGYYTVEGSDIEAWLNWTPDKDSIGGYSYERKWLFDKED